MWRQKRKSFELFAFTIEIPTSLTQEITLALNSSPSTEMKVMILSSNILSPCVKVMSEMATYRGHP